MNARVHVERGLWLYGGASYVTSDLEEMKNNNDIYYKLGADYKVDDNWALGLERVWTAGNSSVNLFINIFY